VPLQTVTIDFLEKGQDLAISRRSPGAAQQGQQQGEVREEGGSEAVLPAGAAQAQCRQGTNRRLLRSAVESWVEPRGAAIRRLNLM
jgi:hypothetical protein